MKKVNNDLVIYQALSGAVEVRIDGIKETTLLTQKQVGQLFDVQKGAISKHVKNIFQTGELTEKATVSILETVQNEKGRKIKRKIEYYNLDLILSIGYRVNSSSATRFRQWATKTLKEHITKGYTINKKQISKNYESFMKAVTDIQVLLPQYVTFDPKMVLELIKEFAGTWVSLDAYDKETLKPFGLTKKAIKLSGEELTLAIAKLREQLIKNKEATDIFARERKAGSVESIVGNVMQTFGRKQLYVSVEEKAAHLLYFMIKNHPFVDGNKRSGAFAFVWFLRKTGIKTRANINSGALTALTLLIAESDPKKKDQMVALVTQILKR